MCTVLYYLLCMCNKPEYAVIRVQEPGNSPDEYFSGQKAFFTYFSEMYIQWIWVI